MRLDGFVKSMEICVTRSSFGLNFENRLEIIVQFHCGLYLRGIPWLQSF